MQEEQIDPFSDDIVLDARFENEIRAFLRQTFTVDDIEELLQNIRSQDLVDQHRGVIGLGSLLIYSTDRALSAQVTETGIVPRIVQLMRQDECPHLKMEAIQLICNIANCNVRVLFEAGIVRDLLELIHHKEPKIQYYAFSTLSDFLMEQGEERGEVLNRNGASILLNMLKDNQSHRREIIEEAFHPLSKICISRSIDYEEIKDILLYFMQCLEKKSLITDEAYKRVYTSFQRVIKTQVYELFVSNRTVLANLVDSLKQHSLAPSEQRYFKQLLYLLQAFTKRYENFMPALFEFDILLVGASMIVTENKMFKNSWYKILKHVSNHQSNLTVLASHYIVEVILQFMKKEDDRNLTLILLVVHKIISNVNHKEAYGVLKNRKVFTHLINCLQVKSGQICDSILGLMLEGLKGEIKFKAEQPQQPKNSLLVQEGQVDRLKKQLERMKADSSEKIVCKVIEIEFILESHR